MRVVVLAGSGLSIPAEYPSTATLTDTVLSGDEGFRPAAFLRRLRELVVAYPFRRDVPVNYEDLAYVVGQIVDSHSGNYDNPALGPLHEALADDIAGILERGGQRRWDADTLARETRRFIADVVWRSLRDERVADHLGPFVEFVRDERLEDVSVFTLNHDTLLERTFRAEGLAFEDGFGDPVNDVRYWDPGRFEASRLTRRLVKLHGSVNWFLFRPDGGQFHEDRIALVIGNDPWHTFDPSGRRQQPVDDEGGLPLLLIGTHNKARGYLNPPFYDAHIEFYRRLNRAAVLLVIGYGGQDKAVNERIVDWMEADLSHRLVIFNETTRIIEQARGALRGHEPIGVPPAAKGFPRWQEQGRFELIPRCIQKVSAADYFAAVTPGAEPVKGPSAR